MVKKPRVSVIIPAYNAKETISKTLDSMRSLDYPKSFLQVIIVDDGSTDDTVNIATSYEGVKVLKQRNLGPATARNTGIKKAEGDIIVFTDADCIVESDWLKKIVKALGEVDIVGGSMLPHKVDSVWESFEQARRDRLYGKKKRFVEELPSCNLAFKREVLDELGGFDASFRRASAEDYDLCRRAIKKGHKILFDPDIQIIHMHSADMGGVLGRAYLHGTQIIYFRLKRGSSRSYEFGRAIIKFFAIPILVLMRYRVGHTPVGFAYEMMSFFGNIKGILTSN